MKPNQVRRAFTLIEMLLVVAIISILAALVISNFSNAARDTRAVVSRQQLAVVQEAVNHWVNNQMSRVTTAGGTGKTVSQVRDAYNAETSTGDRYALFENYLDEATRASLEVDEDAGRISSQAMRDGGKYLVLPDWEAPTVTTATFPKVQLLPPDQPLNPAAT